MTEVNKSSTWVTFVARSDSMLYQIFRISRYNRGIRCCRRMYSAATVHVVIAHNDEESQVNVSFETYTSVNT